MSELLEFLRTHEEAFRSRARLASLYSDFRYQRNTNPDGYQANASAWLRALTNAARAGLLPAQTGLGTDRFLVHTGEELASALQAQDLGRPLALGAVLDDAVNTKDLLPLNEFLAARQSVYARSWIPTPWQVLDWGLRQMGLNGGGSSDDRLVKRDLVIMANVEQASKAVLNQVSKIATSNSSRVFSKDLFNSVFASALGVESISANDLSVLLKHLARDRNAAAISSDLSIIKFKSPSDSQPIPVTEEDQSIASLRTLMAALEPQIQHLMLRSEELGRKAREAVAHRHTIAAKTALRQKKAAETQLQQRTATLAQLEDVYAKIEQAADQVEMVKVMAASSQTLRSLNQQTGGVERVQDVMDGLRDDMATADEIAQAINDVAAGEVDEGEVEDELAALETAEAAKREAAERATREREAAAEAELTRRRLTELESAPATGPSAEVDAEKSVVDEPRAAEDEVKALEA